MIKYVVRPGVVVSKTDGQTHYVDSTKLMALYGVKPSDCYIVSPSSIVPEAYKDLPVLMPRYSGNYKL